MSLRTPGVNLFTATLCAVLAACGGGSGGDDPAPTTTTPTPTAAPPAVTVDVAATSVTAGTDATFSVTASGDSLAYQWQVSTDGNTFTNIPGATGPTLTLTAVTTADGTKFVRVAVSNSAATIYSTAASLYVTPAVTDATIVSQPLDASPIAPNPATFTVVAAGSPAPTYQWQKSTDGGTTWLDIAGASAASYTTPATGTADSGSLFRVNATSATATVASTAARLTVSSTAVAASITTQPVSIAVTVPSTATFGVAAAGSPAPTYQWQVKGTTAGATFANITGATSASYTTPATAAADSGKQFQVVVTNGSGSVTSTPVTLTASVATSVSKLSGRAWTPGQALESGDASVSTNPAPWVGIDDAGNAISVFTKSDGSRAVLYATRGVPGAAGVAPAWSVPVAIDTAAAPAAGSARVLTVAPNGNAAVTWRSTAPCTASTYSTNLSATCNYLYSARYVASTQTWSTPVQLADTPDATPSLVQRVNSQGDFALLYPGWTRAGSTLTTRPAVLWLAAGQSGIRSRVFGEVALNHYDLGMDKDGNLTLAGDATQSSTTDVVVYRGTVANGFGTQEVLEQRTSAATFERLAVGLNGQVVTTWTQSNGTVATRYAASLAAPTDTWSVKELEPASNSGTFTTSNLLVTDAGDGLFAVYANGYCNHYFYRLSGGVWSTMQKFPAALPSCNDAYFPNRNGDLLVVELSQWNSYDAASNTVVRADVNRSAPSVYGVSGGSASLGTSAKALSVSGIGVLSAAVPYDTLPTAAQPAGDGRSSVVNLWGLFLK